MSLLLSCKGLLLSRKFLRLVPSPPASVTVIDTARTFQVLIAINMSLLEDGGRDLFGAQRQAVIEADMQLSNHRPKPPGRHLTMHQDSSQLEDCLYPVRGIRDQQLR